MKVAVLAVAALLAGAQAEAQTMPCLDADGVRALSDFTLGPVASAAATKCAGQYVAQSPTLARERAALGTRFGATGNAAWPKVRDHFIDADPKMRTMAETLRAQDTTLRALATAMMANAVTERLGADGCEAADAFTPALLPLDDARIADIWAVVVRLGLQNNRDTANAGLRLCPAATAR